VLPIGQHSFGVLKKKIGVFPEIIRKGIKIKSAHPKRFEPLLDYIKSCTHYYQVQKK